ncbi:EpsG family protein [Barnesiella propionica]|uniref:EpsG family protein n=1 Tax=Barnesiella propionica TaxID=2981781 RepID=UPI0011CCC0BB|nr:EpsG family protein [Barnesiella propionica]
MLPYIILIMYLILYRFMFFPKKDLNKKHKKMYIIGALIPIFIIAGFRGIDVGTDTPNYIRIFEVAGSVNFLDSYSEYSRLEYGYRYFIYFLASYFSHPQWQFIFVAFFSCIGIGYFVYQNAREPFLAILFFVTLGFFDFTLSGVRQTIAVTVTLFLFSFIKNRKLLWFLVGIFIAALFHKSALFFIPAYFIANNPVKKKTVIVYFLSFFVLFLVADKLLLATADALDYNYGVESTGNGYIFFSIVLIITVLAFKFNKSLIRQNRDNRFMININFCSFMLWGVRLISRTAERITLYYMPYTYVLLEEIIMSRSVSIRRQYYFITVVCCIILYFYRLHNNTSLNPYQFC